MARAGDGRCQREPGVVLHRIDCRRFRRAARCGAAAGGGRSRLSRRRSDVYRALFEDRGSRRGGASTHDGGSRGDRSGRARSDFGRFAAGRRGACGTCGGRTGGQRHRRTARGSANGRGCQVGRGLRADGLRAGRIARRRGADCAGRSPTGRIAGNCRSSGD